MLAVIALVAPIINGSDDVGHSAVVALGTQGTTCDAVFSASCTGTLIAPRVVLTAAHCVQQVRRGSDVLIGRSQTDHDEIHRALEVRIHPQYDDATDTNDIALVILDGAAAVTPLAVRDHALDPSDVGSMVTIVGFGTIDSTASAGTKRQGTAVIESVFANGFQIGPAPSMTCHGDSGGPALLVDSTGESVVGVAVTGDLGCDTVGIHADAGSYFTDFIQPVLDYAASLPEPTPGDASCDNIPPPPTDDGCGCRAVEPRPSILVFLGFLYVLIKRCPSRRSTCSSSVQRR